MEKRKLKNITKFFTSKRIGLESEAKEYAEIREKMKRLTKETFPGSVLIVSLFSPEERYREPVKALLNILDFERIFSQAAIERNPEIAKQMGEALEHLKQFNKIIDKERKKINKKRGKNLSNKNVENSKEEEKPSNKEISETNDLNQKINIEPIKGNTKTIDNINEEDF